MASSRRSAPHRYVDANNKTQRWDFTTGDFGLLFLNQSIAIDEQGGKGVCILDWASCVVRWIVSRRTMCGGIFMVMYSCLCGCLHCTVKWGLSLIKKYSQCWVKKKEKIKYNKAQYRRFQGSVSLLCCQEFKAERSLSVSGVNPFCLNLTESL